MIFTFESGNNVLYTKDYDINNDILKININVVSFKFKINLPLNQEFNKILINHYTNNRGY